MCGINLNFLFLLIKFCIVCSEKYVGANEFRSDYTYYLVGSGWYKLHRVPVGWHSARLQCHYEGAVLASPVSHDVWSTLVHIVNTSASSLGRPRVHLGVEAQFADSAYSSVQGVPLRKLVLEWAENEPNDLDGTESEQCLHLSVAGAGDGRCDHRLPYICYRPSSVADELTECGTVDKEYRLDARTGHCYKFHRHALTWPAARRACIAEGGDLAVIDTDQEALVLKDLMAQYPKLLYTPFQNSASVGFRQWGDKSWWTIDGKPLEEAGYERWSQGQPDNQPSGRGSAQECGSIFRSGLLDDVWCNEPLAFICEKEKTSLLFTTDEIF